MKRAQEAAHVYLGTRERCCLLMWCLWGNYASQGEVFICGSVQFRKTDLTFELWARQWHMQWQECGTKVGSCLVPGREHRGEGEANPEGWRAGLAKRGILTRECQNPIRMVQAPHFLQSLEASCAPWCSLAALKRLAFPSFGDLPVCPRCNWNRNSKWSHLELKDGCSPILGLTLAQTAELFRDFVMAMYPQSQDHLLCLGTVPLSWCVIELPQCTRKAILVPYRLCSPCQVGWSMRPSLG